MRQDEDQKTMRVFAVNLQNVKDWIKGKQTDNFSKEHTFATKGVLTLILLTHHVFYPDYITGYGINTILGDVKLVNRIMLYLKICIAGFAFLTAFGMTRIFRDQKDNSIQGFFRVVVKRLAKLELAVVIVYVLAVLYRCLVARQSLADLYMTEQQSIPMMLLYMCLDMVGLAHYMKTPMINMTWWYLSYVILLIAAMPFIYKAYEKFRYLLLPIGCLLPYALTDSDASFLALLPAVWLGTAFSYENWFEKLRESRKKSNIAQRLLVSIGLIFLGYFMNTYVHGAYCYIVIPVIPYLAYEYLSYIPVARFWLKYIGKHSMNIFLTHTFIYFYYYPDFIYSFRSTWYVLPVFAAVSLALSIMIEVIKKIIGYNRLESLLVSCIDCTYNKKGDAYGKK